MPNQSHRVRGNATTTKDNIEMSFVGKLLFVAQALPVGVLFFLLFSCEK
jgi:hypothetical protein